MVDESVCADTLADAVYSMEVRLAVSDVASDTALPAVSVIDKDAESLATTETTTTADSTIKTAEVSFVIVDDAF